MSRHHSHIASAIKVIGSAVPGEPLAHHLKKFFAADKKYGSKDRKTISSLCYNYYRIGNILKDHTPEERILAAQFLCSSAKSDLLEKRAPELNEKMSWPVDKKLAYLKCSPADIFPLQKQLSEEINADQFALSFLKQPPVYLRIRPGKAVKILEKLTEEKADFEEISTSCIAMPAGSKADSLLKINREVVVQDLSSQQVFDHLLQDTVFLPKDATVWDCCAASGGKSILLYDLLHGHADLHVSDIRENILHNLQNRFKDAGIKKYHSFIADLTDEKFSAPENKYELIICDVPCSGSGTWARNPEQAALFDEKNIDSYAAKQKKIAVKAAGALKPGGFFFYITCSAFRKENEEAVAYLQEHSDLHLLNSKYIKGYENLADTMFVAVFSH